MSEAPDARKALRKKTKRKKASQGAPREDVSSGKLADRAPTNRTWSSKSAVAAVLIAAAVIAIPLYLKSTRSPSAEAKRSPQAAVASAATGQALPRFVDLGTTTCAPCKVMLGVMAELEKKYPGAFIVEFVNVQQDPEGARRYGIQIIPTQIFYGPDGRELYRHIGVFRTEQVIAKWAELGFHFKPSAES